MTTAVRFEDASLTGVVLTMGSTEIYDPENSIPSRYVPYTTRLLDQPVVLYGHETWTMLEEDIRALGVFERRVLRTIYGGVQEQGRWR